MNEIQIRLKKSTRKSSREGDGRKERTWKILIGISRKDKNMEKLYEYGWSLLRGEGAGLIWFWGVYKLLSGSES